MKKYVLAFGLALASLGFGTASNAAVIDSGQISLSGSELTLTGLTSGAQYYLTVSGSGVISRDGRSADAEYFQGAVGDAVWIDKRDGGPDIGVFVDALNVDWGVFNPANVYTIIYTASSATVSLFFNDSFYDDNESEGFLTASISAVPLPASMLGLLAGLAGLGVLRRRKTA